MKIIGAEGLDAHTVRDQVDRGARFVIYYYCISVLVVTFKRPSSIHYLKPGHSRIGRGVPYTFMSLFLGWWGIPWGPIFTIQTITNNLSGGRDVTNEIIASLGPVHDVTTGQPLPPPLPVRVHQVGLGKKIAIGAAFLAVLTAIIIGSICLYRRANLPVVLISGAEHPYDVKLNGESYTVKPNQPLVLNLSQGDYTLEGGPVGNPVKPQTLHLSAPFFDNLSHSYVAVINPDNAALFYKEVTAYYPSGSTAPTSEKDDFSLYAGEVSYFEPAPDFIFTDFPHEIQMAQGVGRETRTRFALINDRLPVANAQLLSARKDYPTLKKYLEAATTLHADDEEWLAAAANYLKPDDARAFLTQGLAARPIHIEWHRTYQEFMRRNFPDFDVVKQYRGFLAASPGDGTLMYLLARQLDDPLESRQLNEQALAAQPPCFYAALSIGYDYLVKGDYAGAEPYIMQAKQGGINNDSMAADFREELLGEHKYDELLAQAEAEAKAQPNNLIFAGEEITMLLAAGHPRAEADQIEKNYLARLDQLNQTAPEDRAQTAAFLTGFLDYGVGDYAGYASESAKIKAPSYQFAASLTSGNLAQAFESLKNSPPQQISSLAWLECYIVARLKGDAAMANTAFANALELMPRDSNGLKSLATMLKTGTAPSLDALKNLSLLPSQKSIVLTALGLRFAENRSAFFKLAQDFNIEPVFPHHLIEQAVASGQASAN